MLRPLSKRKQNDAYLIAHAAIRKDPFVAIPHSVLKQYTHWRIILLYIYKNILLDIESFQISYAVNSVSIRPWGFFCSFPALHTFECTV